MNWTLFIAIWGVVLSTLAIAWNIRLDLLDRGRLKVTAYIGYINSSSGREGRFVIYKTVNVGRRPVVVTNFGGEYSSEKHFVIQARSEIPKRLEPGDQLIEYTGASQLSNEIPRAFWVIDSHERSWRVPRRAFAKLKQDLWELQSPMSG